MRWKIGLLVGLGLAVSGVVGPTFSAFSGTTSNPGSSVSAAASFCSGQSIAWMTGFEHGVISVSTGSGMFDTWGTVGGTPTIETGVVRSGNYSIKVDKTSAGAEHLSIDSTASVAVARFAIRLATLPTATVTQLFRMSPLADTDGANFGYDQASNKFRMKVGTGTTQLSSSTVSAGLWYVIDVRFDPTATTRVADWRVNGVAQPQGSMSGSTATTVDKVRFASNSNSDVFTAYYDDLAVSWTSSDFPLADGRIQALRPDAVTAVNDPAGSKLKDDAGTNVTVATPGAASRLTDTPMTSTSDYLKHIGTDATSYAQFSFADTSRNACVDAVRAVVAEHASNSTGGIGATYVYDGATQRTVAASATISGTSLRYRAATISPTGSAWTAAELNGLVARVGYSSNATSSNYPAWDALLLEYQTTPNPAFQYQNTVRQDSPASYWRLGETSGTTAADVTGGVTGTYTNGPTLGVSSLVGDTDTAVSFDGTNDEVLLGDTYDFPNRASYTIECWVNPSAATATWRRIVAKHGNSSNWDVELTPTGSPPANRVHFERYDGGGAHDAVDSTTALQPGTWYHVAVTYDGANLRLYVNGTLEGGPVASTRNEADITDQLAIGGEGDATNFVGGFIDEVAVYASALSATRIQAHYNAGKL